MNAKMINLDQGLSWQTDDDKAWYERGEELAFAGQYQEALACIDQALAIQPVSHAAWVLKGVVLVQLGQYQEVLICCDKALAIAPSDRQTWIVRGAALNYLGCYKESYANYDKASGIKRYSLKQKLTQALTLCRLKADRFYIQRLAVRQQVCTNCQEGKSPVA